MTRTGSTAARASSGPRRTLIIFASVSDDNPASRSQRHDRRGEISPYSSISRYLFPETHVRTPEMDDEDMFRPPLALGMKILDRAAFQKVVPLKAARVFENKNISKIRSQLGKDALQQERLANVLPDPDVERAKLGKKCILLRPDARSPDDLVKQELVAVIPYDLRLTYDYWTYHDIISAILPIDAQLEIPSGFSQVGHVVHMNLRDAYLPYKHLIASIIMDKNPGAKTVINKIDDVGEENEFRTFKYEVLAGEDDLNVTVSEAGCEFRFDYSKVYWNPRLSTEHRRLVDMFKPGEAVCDVMAGIGPFAVPAGKKGVFVWANDLNPESYACLTDAVKLNHVGEFVRPFNEDGRRFIRDAAAQLLQEERVIEIKQKSPRDKKSNDATTVSAVAQLQIRQQENPSRGKKNNETVTVKTVAQPKVFQHYVLNLPASALTFLSSFVGLYENAQTAGAPMPIVHVYCFSTKDEMSPLDNSNGSAGTTRTDNASAEQKICAEISQQLGYTMRPGKIDGTPGAVEIWDVRDVAPKKRMFCASFRLPEEVVFFKTQTSPDATAAANAPSQP